MDNPKINEALALNQPTSSLYNDAYNILASSKMEPLNEPASKSILGTIGDTISEHPVLSAGAALAAAGALLYLSRGRSALTTLRASESLVAGAGQNALGTGLRLESNLALRTALNSAGEGLINGATRNSAVRALGAGENLLVRGIGTPGALRSVEGGLLATQTARGGETLLSRGITAPPLRGLEVELAAAGRSTLGTTEKLATDRVAARGSESVLGQSLAEQGGSGLRRSLALPVLGLAALGTATLSGCSKAPEDDKDKEKENEAKDPKEGVAGNGTDGSSHHSNSNSNFWMWWWLTRSSSSGSSRPISGGSNTEVHSGGAPKSTSTPHVESPHTATPTPHGNVTRGGFGGGRGGGGASS